MSRLRRMLGATGYSMLFSRPNFEFSFSTQSQMWWKLKKNGASSLIGRTSTS